MAPTALLEISLLKSNYLHLLHPTVLMHCGSQVWYSALQLFWLGLYPSNGSVNTSDIQDFHCKTSSVSSVCGKRPWRHGMCLISSWAFLCSSRVLKLSSRGAHRPFASFWTWSSNPRHHLYFLKPLFPFCHYCPAYSPGPCGPTHLFRTQSQPRVSLPS